jgi:hypothetical protein
MKHYTIVLLCTLWFGSSTNGFGQGDILVQHSGSVNPTNEGFALSVGGSGTTIVGPVTNDLGMNAWTVGGGNVITYSQSLTPIPIQDWTLLIDVHVTQSGGGNGAPPNNFVLLDAGGEFFQLNFGTDSSGNATVRTGTTPGPTIALNATGSVYNNFQLDYNAVADTAALWVNGTEVVDGISGTPAFSGWKIYWGTGQAGPSQANWNLVSLSVPEPSSAALILLGSGALFYLRRKYRR